MMNRMVLCVGGGLCVRVKLVYIGCGAGNATAWGAVVPLFTLVPTAMLIYISIVLYAFTH
ncbi:hypothetical protein [Oryza sativa Japonica Group]|uniref:Uncharacterized protein n=1 Tax=Oryza sativa subsp. japonica TaxID=39947 RepID=Q8LQY5_ORYSJ|nr:hypothetical protein [Oryza sativa Japonica Group]